MNPATLAHTIRQQVLSTCWDLQEAGWTDDARGLLNDLRNANNTADFLMVRDDAERLADQLEANR